MPTCPYCRDRAMSFWRKCVISPDAAVTCASCAREVSVPWLAALAAVPVALGLLAAVRLPLPLSVGGAAAGVVAYLLLQRFAIPLIPAKRVNRQ